MSEAQTSNPEGVAVSKRCSALLVSKTVGGDRSALSIPSVLAFGLVESCLFSSTAIVRVYSGLVDVAYDRHRSCFNSLVGDLRTTVRTRFSSKGSTETVDILPTSDTWLVYAKVGLYISCFVRPSSSSSSFSRCFPCFQRRHLFRSFQRYSQP